MHGIGRKIKLDPTYFEASKVISGFRAIYLLEGEFHFDRVNCRYGRQIKFTGKVCTNGHKMHSLSAKPDNYTNNPSCRNCGEANISE